MAKNDVTKFEKFTEEEAQKLREDVVADPRRTLESMRIRATGEAFGIDHLELFPDTQTGEENVQKIVGWCAERDIQPTYKNLQHAYDALVSDGKLKLEVEAFEQTPEQTLESAQPQGLSAEDKAFRYEIEKLSSDEYRHRLVHEPGFRERADKVMAHEAPAVNWNNPAVPSPGTAPSRPTTPAPVAEFAELLSLSPREFLRAVDKMPSSQWRRILQNSPEVVAKYEAIIKAR